jgi:hypothetical protein
VKRTCNGCRALEQTVHGLCRCELGKTIERKERGKPWRLQYCPTEECPKPITVPAFVAALKARDDAYQTEALQE